jgi:ABC-2 type transport system ATP-binding protein
MIKVQNLSKTFSRQLLVGTFKDLLVHLIKNIKIFRSSKRRKVLNNISFIINKGEVVGISGPNGAGKSTIAKIITGVMSPTTGDISVVGKVVPFLELGVAFNHDLTGLDNMYLNGVLLGLSIAYLHQHKQQIFEYAGITDMMHVPLKYYSSGMQLRLAFSIAMNAHGDIYVFDEILAVGDIDFQKKCIDAFNKLKHIKKTIIIISHDLDFLLKHVDSMLYIERNQCTHINKQQLSGIKDHAQLIQFVSHDTNKYKQDHL